jgi:hypothetical protein
VPKKSLIREKIKSLLYSILDDRVHEYNASPTYMDNVWLFFMLVVNDRQRLVNPTALAGIHHCSTPPHGVQPGWT